MHATPQTSAGPIPWSTGIREWMPYLGTAATMLCAMFALVAFQAQWTQDKIDKAVAPVHVRLDAIEKRMDDRFDDLEQRSVIRARELEERSIIRLRELEARTEIRLGEMEKRTQIHLNEMEKRTIAQFDTVHKALERMSQKLDRR